jgi:hypothetical protein
MEACMSNQNRVLGRMGARQLTPDEEMIVTGAGGPIHTLTVCTIPNTLLLGGDGDSGETC